MDQSRSNTMNMVMEDGVEGFLSGRIAVNIKDQAFFSGSLLLCSWRLCRSFWGEYVSLLFTKVAPFNKAVAAAPGTAGRYGRETVPVVVKFRSTMHQDVFVWRMT